jgi:hypothetical protein
MIRDFARYTNMAFELLVIILLALYAGKKMDLFFKIEKPVLQGIMALLAVIAYLTILLIRIQHKNTDDKKKNL